MKPFLPKEIPREILTGFAGLSENDQETSLKDRCVEEVLTAFPRTSTFMFQKNYKFIGDVTNLVYDIYNDLKKGFKDVFQQVFIIVIITRHIHRPLVMSDKASKSKWCIQLFEGHWYKYFCRQKFIIRKLCIIGDHSTV